MDPLETGELLDLESRLTESTASDGAVIIPVDEDPTPEGQLLDMAFLPSVHDQFWQFL